MNCQNGRFSPRTDTHRVQLLAVVSAINPITLTLSYSMYNLQHRRDCLIHSSFGDRHYSPHSQFANCTYPCHHPTLLSLILLIDMTWIHPINRLSTAYIPFHHILHITFNSCSQRVSLHRLLPYPGMQLLDVAIQRRFRSKCFRTCIAFERPFSSYIAMDRHRENVHAVDLIVHTTKKGKCTKLCNLRCATKLCFTLNALGQNLHLNGRSPVWIRIWSFRLHPQRISTIKHPHNRTESNNGTNDLKLNLCVCLKRRLQCTHSYGLYIGLMYMYSGVL